MIKFSENWFCRYYFLAVIEQGSFVKEYNVFWIHDINAIDTLLKQISNKRKL